MVPVRASCTKIVNVKASQDSPMGIGSTDRFTLSVQFLQVQGFMYIHWCPVMLSIRDGFLDGGLVVSRTPGSYQASIGAMPRWVPFEWFLEIIRDDSCLVFGIPASVLQDLLVQVGPKLGGSWCYWPPASILCLSGPKRNGELWPSNLMAVQLAVDLLEVVGTSMAAKSERYHYFTSHVV